MPRQTSIQVTEATERQAKALQAVGFGSFTDIVRLAIDRMFLQESIMDAHEMAKARFSTTPQLAQYETIIFADWSEGDEHWRWVVNAPIDEIVGWAAAIESQQEE